MKHAYQRWLIRASLFHMGLGFLLGLWMYMAPVFELPFAFLDMRTVHVHLILLGGVMQMIMGVALWMFPRMLKAPHYTSPRQGMLLCIVFNCGVLLRSSFELLGRDLAFNYILALVGVVLEMLALFFFGWLIASRIRMPGSKK